MFTGIITDIGKIASLTKTGTDTHLRIHTQYDTASITLGASIACNGICLTVTETQDDWFAVTASSETASITTLSDWREGDEINLERALALGDELGGHLVSGHVDGTATIQTITTQDECTFMQLEIPQTLQRYLAHKGSVCVDGISLTVNAVNDPIIDMMIIPHTLTHTNLKNRVVGDRVNIEIDLMARYIERMMKVTQDD